MKTIDARDENTIIELRNDQSTQDSLFADVGKIIEKVRLNGDRVLISLTSKFDGVLIDELRATERELKDALRNLAPKLRTALERSISNQQTLQKSLLDKAVRKVQVQKGVKVWREWRPIERVRLYVPGGLAAYPSTVIMNVVPAQVAGCRGLAIPTPIGKDGKINSTVLAVAAMLGITEIYRVGGAQAIAALAYGLSLIHIS